MTRKPTYEELLQKIEKLEEEKRIWTKGIAYEIKELVSEEIQPDEQHKDALKKMSSLGSIINVEELQSIMDDFYHLTGMVTAILDMEGNVIEATGWRDICTQFHRIHPKTAQNCTESDLYLVKNIKPGKYIGYQCKNGLWDVVTPLYIGNKHMGNIYTGQFFYDDDSVDETKFIQQAEKYGFDKKSYMKAFHRIPRYSREEIKHLMGFLVKFTSYISSISYAKKKLEMEIHERKHAEEALQLSEGRLRALITALPDLIWLKDMDGRYLACNARFEQFFGAKEKQIQGKTDYDFVNKDLADLFCANDRAAIEQGGPNINEEEITFADDGHKEVLETIKTPMYSKNGQVLGVLGIGRNITERKRAEKTIRENESYLRSVFRAAPAGIGVVHNRIFSQVNNKLCEMLGYSQEELIGQSARIVYPDDEKYKRVGKDKYQQISQSGTGTVETQFVCKDGRKIDVLLSSTPIEIDNLEAGVTFTALDITSFKDTQAALKRSETKYRKMMEAIKDPIYICSDDFIIQYMNQAMIERIGHDATGELCYEALHGFNKKCQWCKHYKTFLKGHTGKNILSPLDNRSFHVSSTIFDNENGSLSKIAVFRDTTELIELQTRLQQAQKMEAIGNLAGGIAHDFNNILFPIIGMSEMMMEDLPTGSMEQEYAHGIHKAGHRAKELVSQILAFSRQSDQEKIPVRFQNILREVLKLCQSTIPANIKIEPKIQQDCGSIHGNSTQLHQIAMNLITNACHAVEKKNGKIAVGLEEIKIDRINFADTLINPGNYLLFTVSDDGTGMTDNVKEKIFEPYFTTKEQGKGTGLGLSVVYGIVKEYGGEIQVETEIGSGTKFRIYLPLIGESKNQRTSETKPKLETGHEHILLVDDEASIIKLEQQMLERLGYQITSYTSSLDAIEVFYSNPDVFDLVITDMTMPNMTGDELAKNILSIKPDTPIIICTGFSERINKEQAGPIGIKGFLMKPVVRSDMAQMVRKVLDEAQKTQ